MHAASPICRPPSLGSWGALDEMGPSDCAVPAIHGGDGAGLLQISICKTTATQEALIHMWSFDV
uniref:Uncharacterized protein n=1 Tax=Arundo donax TaxID=35708 RepID=A0A0A9BS86_ARUDO